MNVDFDDAPDSEKNPENNKGKKEDAYTKAIMGIFSTIKTWINQYGDPCMSALLSKNGSPKHMRHFPIESSDARAMIGAHLIQNGMAKGIGRLIEDAKDFLIIQARILGVTHHSYSRVAGNSETIYLNMMDDQGRAIEIDKHGWRTMINPPVKFINPPNGFPLPEPDPSGKIEMLDEILNVESVEDRNMIASYLFSCLFPDGPYPILVINGEQGSAKSTTTRYIRMLIDPAAAPARSLPESERDLVIAAHNNWVLSFDNLSKISDSISDAMCRLATGSGFGVRKHYANSEEVIFEATRPIILNGIENIALRQDLLSRCIVINLPAIPKEKCKTQEELDKTFQELRPKIFGALLNAVSASLRNIEHVKPKELPRMADFAKRVISAEKELGWKEGGFLSHYLAVLSASAKEASEGDIVLTAILQHMNSKSKWEGTASELRDIIIKNVPADKTKYVPAVNKLPISRLQPVLRTHGLIMKQTRTEKVRLIVIENNNPNLKIDVKTTAKPTFRATTSPTPFPTPALDLSLDILKTACTSETQCTDDDHDG